MNKLYFKDVKNAVPDGIFGFNLEITRKCFYGGLSAEMLINRKFFAVDKEKGTPKGWVTSGGFVIDDKPEQSLCSSNFVMLNEGGSLSHANDLLFKTGEKHFFRIWAEAIGGENAEITVNIGEISFDIKVPERHVTKDTDVIETEFLAPSGGPFSIDCRRGSIYIYEVSLLPCDNFFGMRKDVIDLLKELRPSHLRYPGGCCTDHFDFKESLKPVSERKPLHVPDKWFVFLDTFDQDPYDIGLNEFIELCKEVGAEPEYTVRVVNTDPREAAELVEYCEGGPETVWGGRREALGHKQFGIKRWYVGNEVYYFGYDLTKDGKKAAAVCDSFADAMKSVREDLYLIGGVCGDFEHDDWDRAFIANAKTKYDEISFHCYCGTPIDDKQQDTESLAKMSRLYDDGVHKRLEWVKNELFGEPWDGVVINVDEWNLTWGAEGHTLMMLADALTFHFFLRSYDRYHIRHSRFFHPVNEGMIRVTPRSAYLDCVGILMKYMDLHRGGDVLEAYSDEPDLDVLATLHPDGSEIVSVINRGSKESCLDTGLSGADTVKLSFSSCSGFEDNVIVIKGTSEDGLVQIGPYETLFLIHGRNL